MATKKYVLVGRTLSADEVQNFPQQAKFSSQDANEWRSLTAGELIQDESFHHLDRLSTLMLTAVKLQCPVGPHDDPGLDVSVIRACSISKTGSVAVQCTQGHWAEYPCG